MKKVTQKAHSRCKRKQFTFDLYKTAHTPIKLRVGCDSEQRTFLQVKLWYPNNMDGTPVNRTLREKERSSAPSADPQHAPAGTTGAYGVRRGPSTTLPSMAITNSKDTSAGQTACSSVMLVSQPSCCGMQPVMRPSCTVTCKHTLVLSSSLLLCF